MEPEGSLPHSQEPATCPHPKPYWPRPSPHPTPRRSILIVSFHLRLGLPSPQVSALKPCMHISSPPYVLLTQPISISCLDIWGFAAMLRKKQVFRDVMLSCDYHVMLSCDYHVMLSCDYHILEILRLFIKLSFTLCFLTFKYFDLLPVLKQLFIIPNQRFA